jgi:hypothetical protein
MQFPLAEVLWGIRLYFGSLIIGRNLESLGLTLASQIG